MIRYIKNLFKKPLKKKWVSTLEIRHTGGSWKFEKDCNEDSSNILLWKDFYKWYFFRENSEDFVMKSQRMDTLFKKSQITQFIIDRFEKEYEM